jgi:NAD(P)-dependent dehydrogenase (short-subunit alcohol dehydrogenase family)
VGRLSGKRVIITGGSTGIGAAIASRFLGEDAQVAVWCRNLNNARQIKKELPALADVVCVDIASVLILTVSCG